MASFAIMDGKARVPYTFFMHAVLQVLIATWQVLVFLAPYLLIGFLVAGAVSVLLSADWVRRHMGGRGGWQVVKAALVGIPLPLCSCGVLPLALSLRRQGAGRGAVVSFLASTPQTGVDSIIATWAVLGPAVSLFRVAAALVSGVLAGGLVMLAYPHETEAPMDEGAACACGHAHLPVWRHALRHGLVTLPRDMARPLLAGMLISGVLTALLPPNILQGEAASGWRGYGLALLAGIPLYVCSTASIPLAASFIHMGMSPGAAMTFLIAGPATNPAMLTAIWSQIGKAGTGLYLLAIALTAVGMGWLLDRFFPAALAAVPVLQERCAACASEWWGIVAAIILVILLAPVLWKKTEDDESEE